MLAHYNAAVPYIRNESVFLGPGHAGAAATKTAQLKHFSESLTSFSRDVADSTALMSAVMADTSESLTDDQRKSIAEGVSLHMRGLSSTAVADSKTQSHMYLHYYTGTVNWRLI